MAGFVLLVCAIAIVGCAVAKRLFLTADGAAALEETTPAELLTAGCLIGVSSWLAVSWALALTHTLTRPALLAAGALFVAAAAIVTARRRLPRIAISPAWLVAAIPIALWVVFALWRGAVLPPDNHDALAYHMPKAVFMVRDHGFRYFEASDTRISTLPCNYELLVADVMLMTGSDQITEWINTAAYLLFLIATAAVVERWWGPGAHVAVVALVTAATPLLLLHSSADKNDLLTCDFAIAALLWGARWYARGGAASWFLMLAALAGGVGTKPQAVFVLAGLAPFLLWRGIGLARSRALRVRDLLITVAVSIVLLALCGAAPFGFDLARGSVADPRIAGQSIQGGALYGDWANIWQFPILLLMAPFSPTEKVWVPWRHAYWFWPRYELYFSNYGVLFTLAVVALPICVWRYRRSEPVLANERLAFTFASVLAFALTLPLVFRPVGFFAGAGRYVAFIIPSVYAWTIAPAARDVARISMKIAVLLTLAIAILFVQTAIDYAENDRFSPFSYAEACAAHPGTHRLRIGEFRAGYVVDRAAGPDDVVAIDGAFDTWIYPAMGARQTRPIVFIPPGPGPVRIPADAKWVVIDRAWNCLWGNPNFTDFSKFWSYIGRGRPSPDDVRVLQALWHDPRYQLVYYYPRFNQAIFRRK